MRRAKPPTHLARFAPDKPKSRRPEQRIYGLHACLAAFAKRPGDVRKVYLTAARLDTFKPVLAHCAKHRIGYRIVDSDELERISASVHHEGVCFEMARTEPLGLERWLSIQTRRSTASLLLWLDGIDNPHNFGALLRTAAHFGANGVLLPNASSLDRSGAAARVARGGAEVLPILRTEDAESALRALRQAGYAIAATVPHGGADLYERPLPRRLVLVFGAEDEGIRKSLVTASDLRLRIPGSGDVESLNVAASVAVILGEYWRQGSGPTR